MRENKKNQQPLKQNKTKLEKKTNTENCKKKLNIKTKT